MPVGVGVTIYSAVQELDGDTFYFSEHDYDEFMRKLINFALESFDLWVNSVVVDRSMREILSTLDSVSQVSFFCPTWDVEKKLTNSCSIRDWINAHRICH